ncbi:MAG: hypothetical protein VX236_03630 [Pseudomonadota bacterium]|nr:hypothetical protein [Pseudomonadota bacterium]
MLPLIPLIAMQFTTEVAWSLSDFVIMGAMLMTFVSVFVVLARKAANRRRGLIGILSVLLLLCLWAALAVGVFMGWGS